VEAQHAEGSRCRGRRSRQCRLVPHEAVAWGNEGHRIICQIAFERLTPAGKTLVSNVFADRTEVKDPFANCSTFVNARATA
jgi:hypothetical protein